MKNGGLFTDTNGKFSKGKAGGVLVLLAGFGVIIGKFMQGEMDIMAVINAATIVGTGLGIFGIRDSKK